MRTVLLPICALLLPACTVTDAPTDAPQPSPVPAATAPAPTAPATTAPSPPPAVTTTAATPGELRTFGDWAVGCDNTALCQMASLGAESGAPPAITMAVLRQPGPGGAVDLSFDVVDTGNTPAPVAPVAVTIDGRRIALPTLSGAAASRVAAAMANGATMAILESGNRERARLSLKGASAALRWIDARQGRTDTVTALVAKGTKPATAVPERPAAPVVRALVATGPAATPTPAQVATMRRRAACETDRIDAADMWKPRSYALGGGATLVMLPCSAGAYNLSSALFVMRGTAVEPPQADTPTGFDPDQKTPTVVNGAWKNGELTSFAKARGIGDCGVRQTMVWDGTRLRLTEQSEMGECRGNTNYITTWRTQVVRQ